MRSDGRVAEELRPVSLIPDFTEDPLGSVLAKMGRTMVLCTVCEDPSVPRFLLAKGRGWITAEYDMLPAATSSINSRATRFSETFIGVTRMPSKRPFSLAKACSL